MAVFRPAQAQRLTFEGQNKQIKTTHTRQRANSLQCFLNEPSSADMIIQPHPSKATRESNTRPGRLHYLFTVVLFLQQTKEAQKLAHGMSWKLLDECSGPANRPQIQKAQVPGTEVCLRANRQCQQRCMSLACT